MSNNEKKFGLFKKKEPKEISKEEIEKEQNGPKNIGFYFKLLKRNFSKLLSLNFYMIFMALPILAAAFIYLQGPTHASQTSLLSPTLFGAELISGSPAVSLMGDAVGIEMLLPSSGSPVYYIAIGVLALLAVTWGWQNVGAAYITRSMVRGEPIFMWSDFFYAIKKNLKQGFLMGLIDFILIAVLIFDISYFSGASQSFAQDVMFFCTIGLAIIYMLMRYYIYIMLVTFDLSIFKMLKNALIFTVLGIKRNVLATLWIVLVALINFILVMFMLPMGIVVPLILPFVYFLPFATFTTTYAAYPNIQKYMIDPQISYTEDDEE